VFLKRIVFLLIWLPGVLHAQVQFQGTLLNSAGNPYAGVDIHKGVGKNLATTDANGKFIFEIPLNEAFAFVGYVKDKKIFGYHVGAFQKDTTLNITIKEGSGMEIIPIANIDIGSGRPPFMEEIHPRDIAMLPTTGGGIETIIKSLGPVTSGNELSSQYNVRGGNFDENLVYVNDIEIYRPQLIHSGQQEGLSFINADLVKTLRFSAGGFEAQYGDKMSSVLDVDYLRPDSFGARINASILLNSVSVEGRNKKFSWIGGVRYFSNSLLTNSLDVEGAYQMSFADAQTLISYRFSPKLQLEFLGNVAINRYSLIPQSRRTEFGTVQAAYQLDVYMGGAENMRYDYGMGALTLRHHLNKRSEMKWIFAVTGSNEQEYFDVEGAYYLSLLDRDLGSQNLGKPLKTLGFGYFIDHGRNRLQTAIYNFSHIGTFGIAGDKNIFKYGVRLNYESIDDKYKEWRYNDSDYYNIPPFGFATDSIILDDVVYAKNTLKSYRGQAFAQNRFRLNKEKNMWLGVGLRFNWWEVTRQFFATPRVNFSFEPNRKRNKGLPDSLKRNDMVLKLSAGGYFQPGFYRELRDFDGNLNRNLKAQESWHIVGGMDRFFNMWDRRFKLTTEAYYKTMSRLDPYLYDNIRIRYYAENSSHGYAYGIDNRINGEFVKGLESWFALSFMQSREKITYTDENGVVTESGWLRRPTDRRVNFAAVFQDELPSNPSFRANLNLLIGTGTPYFLDGKARYSTTPNTVPPYRRLDLGLSKVIIGQGSKYRPKKAGLQHIKEAWISLEVFNLLGINNVIAYSWVKDLDNNTYGVPEYLTSRRLNLRLHLGF
jgi:hypothetical protein